MKKRETTGKGCVFFILTALSLALAPVAQAGPAASISGGYNTYNPDGTAVYGWQFDVFSSVLVTDLGFFDYGSDGLAESHEIGLWDAAGNLLASTTIAAGTGTALIDGFRYTDIADVSLTVGNGYIIAATNIDVDQMMVGATVMTDSAIAYNWGRFEFTGGSLVRPTRGFCTDCYFGPNFLINGGTPPAVPAPAGIGLIGLGLAGIGFSRRGRRCRGQADC